MHYMNFRIKFHKNSETMLIALGHLVNNRFAIPQKSQKKHTNKKNPKPHSKCAGFLPCVYCLLSSSNVVGTAFTILGKTWALPYNNSQSSEEKTRSYTIFEYH